MNAEAWRRMQSACRQDLLLCDTNQQGIGTCYVRFAEKKLLSTFPFFIPRHLDGFQLAFCRCFWVVSKVGQLCHIAVQVGKAHRERVNVRVFLLQKYADVFGVIPSQFHRLLR